MKKPSFTNNLSAIALFSTWNLRRRLPQVFPIAIVFLLLTFITQTIGTLHDIASTATRQTIAQNWRGPYDLLIRPQGSVSQLERTTNWIDPQSLLETYGGISDSQIAAIRSLPHVASIAPVANLGWQTLDVRIPLTLPSKGVYRISASWAAQGTTTPPSVYYIDVTDLHTLTTQPSLATPIVTHLIANADKPIIVSVSLPAMQALIGVPTTAQDTLAHLLSEGISPTAAVHLDKLSGDLATLPTCLNNVACWIAQPVYSGTLTYQPDGIQLLRYSPATYTATSQQMNDGQLTLTSSGTDIQGPLYRTLLPSSVPISSDLPANSPTAPLHVLPLVALAHLPLITNAIRFIPLAKACAINGPSCYSGLYIRLSGTENYSQSSLALLQATSAAITARTGFHVDILDGSSLRTITFTTPSSHQSLQSSWRVVGVAVQIVHGLDAIQTLLLILCSTVCLLAIAMSGILVGLEHRKAILLLQQLGWQPLPILFVLILDALILCLPGCLLATTWLILTTTLWPNTLPPCLVWSLLAVGMLLYCAVLVSAGFSARPSVLARFPMMLRPLMMFHSTIMPRHPMMTARVITTIHGSCSLALADSRRGNERSDVPPVYSSDDPCGHHGGWGHHGGVGHHAILFLTLFASVLLIAIEYLLLTNFDHTLVVTVLGNQVRATLEVPQLLLILLILASAYLTVNLCAVLILHGRRGEISLLAQLGWQRRDVLLRLLRDHWPIALLSGELSVICALSMVYFGGTLPSLADIAALLLAGPLISFLLVNTAMLSPAWQAMKRVYLWK